MAATALTAVTAGCGAAGGGVARDSPSEVASTPAAPVTLYAPPGDPCAAVPAALADRLGLREPSRRTDPLFEMDSTQPQDPLVGYDQTTCVWVVRNPGRGADGRPNQMTASVSYAVIDPARPAAEAVAESVWQRGREKLSPDAPPVRASVEVDDGYYAYVTQKSPSGAGGVAEAGVRLANAVVTVRFTGADLRSDPSRPVGDQLVTTPVGEKRLKPTVDSLLPESIGLLK